MAKKILIIEDEKILGDMYAQKFLQAGFEVKITQSAEGGFRVAKKEQPDLILLDILLPKKNGIAFLEKIRKDPKTSSLKVLAFSNYEDPQVIKEAKELDVIEYLLKTSFTPTQVLEKVKEYLE